MAVFKNSFGPVLSLLSFTKKNNSPSFTSSLPFPILVLFSSDDLYNLNLYFPSYRFDFFLVFI